MSSLLAGLDVVLFIEAFMYRILLRKQAAYNYSVTLDKRSWASWSYRPVDSGLLIFSKYPFDIVEKEIYKFRSGIDRFSCKGIIMVRITVNGTELDMYGIHMQSESTSKREKQTESQDGRNIVVVGDMNMGPLEEFSYFNWTYENMDDKVERIRN